jgi:hypothetical protein
MRGGETHLMMYCWLIQAMQFQFDIGNRPFQLTSRVPRPEEEPASQRRFETNLTSREGIRARVII